MHDPRFALTTSEHRACLVEERRSLIAFYSPNIVDDSAGYHWLDSAGAPLAGKGAQLWLNARMLHCFATESTFGTPECRRIAEHGLRYLTGPGLDAEYGGWSATVGGDSPQPAKELYGQAHVLLAASSCVAAGLEGADELMALARTNIERFWVEHDGRALEAWDRTYSTADTYRGQNANMHLTEAFIAAFDATDDPLLLERAVRIASMIAGPAARKNEGAWRLNEHFDSTWTPMPHHNLDDPRHAFRPYGSQPGHWLEWAKLLCQLRARGVDEEWLLPAARHLFDGAFADGWAANGGFCYTVDWDGSVVVPEKYWWEVAEGIGAAAFLFEATGEDAYARAYAALWEYAHQYVIDHERGGWHHELSADNEAVEFTWTGKPDLYHAYQATLYEFVGAKEGFTDAADRALM